MALLQPSTVTAVFSVIIITGVAGNCGNKHWQCDDGGCIPRSWRCDGTSDCLDGSDEMACFCPKEDFECFDGTMCVISAAVCDGRAQCPDRSDELNCNQTVGCLSGDWKCDNHICIPLRLRCNGFNDCGDNSDEVGCGSCGDLNVRCPDGTCLMLRDRCDGVAQCSDGRDEPVTCGQTCREKNGGCSHTCTDQLWGALCSCPTGLKLASNGAKCEDVNECSQPYGPCMQMCINTKGSFQCRCQPGFKLQGGNICQAQGNDTKLLTTKKGVIGLINVKDRAFKNLFSINTDSVALALDFARNLIYWVDGNGNIYKARVQKSKLIFSGQSGINSLAVDWLTEQLYWTNSKLKGIYTGASDGSAVGLVMSKDTDPTDLVILPNESTMFWINKGMNGAMTIERAGMDGSLRTSLVVVTAQRPRDLTLDVAARRLYWISDFKMLVETVKVDGTGRHTLQDFFKGGMAQSLAVFNGWFYWADDRRLWQAPQNQSDDKRFVLKAALPILTVYHELQQPSGLSPCRKSGCKLCLPSTINAVGFTCSCPEGKIPVSSGSCINFKLAYATSKRVFTLEYTSDGPVKSLLFSSNEDIQSFDISWKRGWVFWTNGTGHVKAKLPNQDRSEYVPTLKPACIIRVDQRTDNLYWVSCDGLSIGATHVSSPDQSISQQLYQAREEINSLFVDWKQGQFYWLEDSQIIRMKLGLLGGDAKAIYSFSENRVSRIVFDRRANSFLWKSQNELQVLCLLKMKNYSAGGKWSSPGLIVDAYEPFMVTLHNDVITLWKRQDGTLVRAVAVESGIVDVAVAINEFQQEALVSSTQTSCRNPSFLCSATTMCISQAQLCDGKRDCPDGSDESSCTQLCTKPDDVQCKDRATCIKRYQMCDGHLDCNDGSDEVDCLVSTVSISTGPLKCRLGLKPCNDGSECVLYSHVCDGEVDCKDGSDEQGCKHQCQTHQFQCAHGKMCIDRKQVCDGTPDCQDRSDEMDCFTHTKSCSHRCDNKTRCIPESFLCDGERDCTDGTDEANCRQRPLVDVAPTEKPSAAPSCESPLVLCEGTSLCISQSQLCDGILDCLDGFDELHCLHACFDPGHFMCKNRRKCVEQVLVCDGRADCPDGSDELQCPTCPLHCDEGTVCLIKEQFCDGQVDCGDGSDEINCYINGEKPTETSLLKCPLGSKPCEDASECILYSHFCDGEKDCKDGSDEKYCERKCNKGQFQCSHGMMCIDKKQVCDGTPDCQDRSDEMDCYTRTKSCSHRCDNKTRCIPENFLCDGERDCADGTDEAVCQSINKVSATAAPTEGIKLSTTANCRSPAVQCEGTSVCINQSQLCDGKMDCPDGFDELYCLHTCSDPGHFLCKNKRKCIERVQVCDGHFDCPDGSDELQCSTCFQRCDEGTVCLTKEQLCDGRMDCKDATDEQNCYSDKKPAEASPLKCRLGLKPCSDGSECVLNSHFCDGERDCNDGSDEKDCEHKCKTDQFQCAHGKMCISKTQMCDGTPDCQDRSDEMDCFTRTQSCSHRCDNKTRCIPENFLCDGERDCADGTDETGCLTNHGVKAGSNVSSARASTILSVSLDCQGQYVLCKGTTLCISRGQVCDGKLDCPDGFDELSCSELCQKRGDFLCKNRKCIKKYQVCDGRLDCTDGSDERDCATAVSTSKAGPLTCRWGSKLCNDGSDCVMYSHICDGEVDCKDKSDEEGCDLQCNPGQFQCSLGRKCIDKKQVCDGTSQCPDNSDEATCWKPTRSCALRCDKTNICIPEVFVCNGIRDCWDGSDETDCGSNSAPNSWCKSPFIPCLATSQCILQRQLCDGRKDCGDGSDERPCLQNCTYNDDFLCKDRRRCIGKNLVCDGRLHCTDGSDEVNCPTEAPSTSEAAPLKCRLGLKSCKDGSDCIRYSHVCDGEVDCKDGSDEEDCDDNCKAGQFLCAHGKKCIDAKLVCDGKPHCQDRSDEMDCFTRTKSCSHRCDNKTRCIPEDFLCDGERDCADGTDEEDCGYPTQSRSCESPSVLCRGGKLCISSTQLCDGKRDCPDGFDEESCIKRCPKKGDFLCKDSSKCVEGRLVCDGRTDCADGSDEKTCPTVPAKTNVAAPLKCLLGWKPCKDGTECVLYSHVCDGEVDCKDRSDEEECQNQCPPGNFQCAHGRMCIEKKQVCDGTPDCQDRSDEMDCFTQTWSCSHRCDNKTRCIPENFLCDGERDCVDGTDEVRCTKEQCLHGQFQCASGQCIALGLRCDGHADCRDHSDEKNCRKPPHCPLKQRCLNSHECLLKEWFCDGDKDCSDGYDEQNCKVSSLQCGPFQCSCASKNQCIPKSWRCDGEKDCIDQSDESGCNPKKCSKDLFECGSKECVDHWLVCNGVTNCMDGSDEGPRCLENNCTSIRRPPCEHYCVNTPQGSVKRCSWYCTCVGGGVCQSCSAQSEVGISIIMQLGKTFQTFPLQDKIDHICLRCGCHEGFELQADGLSCADIDECKDVQPDVCSQNCRNTHGSYVCQCHPGFILEPDRRTCKTQDEPHLLASVWYEVLAMGLRSHNLRALISPNKKPVFTLDYDLREQRVFWVSLQEESIRYAVHGEKANVGTLAKGVKSDSIAVDWVVGNLYWIDGIAGQILAVKISDSVVRPQNFIVVLDEDLDKPRSLVLLPLKRLMLWSEVGSEPKIKLAGMDGSSIKVVLAHGLKWPVALAVDMVTDRIYWADEKLKCIGSATMNGEDIRLLQLTETSRPFSVAVFNDMLYWSDTQNMAIHGSKVSGKNHKIILKRLGQPFGIKVVHPILQPKVSNPCDKLRCSHICLLSPEIQAVCRCPAKLLLAEDGLTCNQPKDSSDSFLLLLSPTRLTQIFTGSLRLKDGLKRWPGHSALALPGINEASILDLVVGDSLLYVADASQAAVAQIKVGNSNLMSDGYPLHLPGDIVTALAVDWITHNLYWSSSKKPQIFVTSAGGKYRVMVLDPGFQDTTSITLHPPTGRLCFTAMALSGNEALPQVDCAAMDGRNRVVVWKKMQTPRFLTFSSQGTTLYWADISAEMICSVDIDGSNYREYKTGVGSSLIVSLTRSEGILFWSTRYNGTSKVWYSDGIQPKRLWFEVPANIVALKAYSKYSQRGSNLCAENNGGCDHLCLPYPGGRTCRCTQSYIAVNDVQCVSDMQCPAGTKPCNDRFNCVSITKFCDKILDCQDGSDEENCVPQSEVFKSTMGSQTCDSELCNGHGQCVMQDGKPSCECVNGYSGQFCQDGGSRSTPVVFAIIVIIGLIIVAAVFLKWRREKVARGPSIDKETLMKDLEEQETHPENFSNELYNPEREEEQATSIS